MIALTVVPRPLHMPADEAKLTIVLKLAVIN